MGFIPGCLVCVTAWQSLSVGWHIAPHINFSIGGAGAWRDLSAGAKALSNVVIQKAVFKWRNSETKWWTVGELTGGAPSPPEPSTAAFSWHASGRHVHSSGFVSKRLASSGSYGFRTYWMCEETLTRVSCASSKFPLHLWGNHRRTRCECTAFYVVPKQRTWKYSLAKQKL